MKRMIGYSAMMSGCLLVVAGCNVAEPAPVKQELTRKQELGESTRTVWVRGEGAGLVPTYSERMGSFVFNRVRTVPHHFLMADMMGNPIMPNTPAQFQPYMAETGRWQAQHNLETGCDCTAAAVGYNPMDPMTAANEKYVGATCCTMGIKEGVPACVGPLVGCKDPEATLRTERWKLLNPGPAQIRDEQGFVEMEGPLTATDFAGLILGNKGLATAGATQAFALTQSLLTVVPEDCRDETEPTNSCPVGVCKEPGSGSLYCTKDVNTDCIGLCDGAPQQIFCVLEEKIVPEECKPENYAQVRYLGVLTGITEEPSPALVDGIHHQITLPAVGDMAPMTELESAFGIVPMDQINYAVHYYERNGDPIGTPRSMKVVVDDACNDLAQLATQTDLPNLDPPVAAPFRGATYSVSLPATPGCHKYVFVARDGDGFEYTYPEYGSLQALINAEKKVAENDDTCPIWTEARVNLTCAGAGVDCEAGDTRACYTGRHGTEDNGECKTGMESCVNGRWSGACMGEVKPEAEVCDDKKDNDCNGGVDEGCPIVLEPPMEPEPPVDMGTPDMSEEADMAAGADMGTPDMGMVTPPKKTEDDGCSATGGHGNVTPSLLAVAFGLLGMGWRRRRHTKG
jgi:hypothetical protein